MIKRIIYIFFSVFLLCSSAAYAECMEPDFYGKLGSEAVNVIESDNSIDIYALIKCTGSLRNKVVPKTAYTYKQAFMNGISYVWDGVYNGKTVRTHIKEHDCKSIHAYINVIIKPVTGEFDYPYAYVPSRTIWLYNGDGRCSYDYSYEDFLYVSGHEFGHAALGLADAYNDSNTKVVLNLLSPMNGWYTRHASEADYYMIMKHKTWRNRYFWRYGNDDVILKKYLTENIGNETS